jgi:hypothetical protein
LRYTWLLIGVSIAFIDWALQGRIGLSLWDEGFLWYGVQRIKFGEVPIRDFYAYDIGRYYLLSGFQKIWGDDGIVALRFGLALLNGLLLGLVGIVLHRQNIQFIWVFLGMVLINMWAYPHYRMTDITVIVTAVAVLTWIGCLPARSPYFFWAGVLYAITVLLLGDVRKHISFFVVALVITLFVIELSRRQWRLWLPHISDVIFGLMVGLLPLLGYALAVPDFAEAYWLNYIDVLLTRSTPNIPLPFPYPWEIDTDRSWQSWRQVVVGWVFVLYVGSVLIWLAWFGWRAYRGHTSNHAALAGIAFAVPSISYVLSRPDVPHLAQGMVPFVMTLVVMIGTISARWLRTTTMAVSIVVSCIVLMPLQPVWQCRIDFECRNERVLHDDIVMPGMIADQVRLIHQVAEDFVESDGNLYIAPFWPGGYALLGQKSPVWEIYAIWPRDEQFELDEIERIKQHNVHAVLLQRFGMDGREELSFRSTHPVTYNYLRETYQTVPVYRDNLPGYMIMRRRTP